MWKSKENKDTYEWTSLRGNDKHDLLKKLPQYIPDIIDEERGQKIKELWEVQ